MGQWPTAESKTVLFNYLLNKDLFFLNLFHMTFSTLLSEFWIPFSCIIRRIDCSDSLCATSAHSRAHGLCFSV